MGTGSLEGGWSILRLDFNKNRPKDANVISTGVCEIINLSKTSRKRGKKKKNKPRDLWVSSKYR